MDRRKSNNHEQVNCRLTIELKEWIHDQSRNAKKIFGEKIPKEQIIEAAVIYMNERNLDWSCIKNQSDILEALRDTE